MRHEVIEASAHTANAATATAGALVAVDGRTYPLSSVELIARTEGGHAVTTLAQSFDNPYDEPLEVHYTLPLPADGAVLAYTVKLGERVLRGEIETREKATAKHRQALREGRISGLLEQDRINTFQQSLGNVPARTRVEVTVEVLHPLVFQAAGATSELPATWEYRFPTVVGVRYHGAEGRVPDAGAVSPPRAEAGTPVRASLALTVGGGQPVTGLTSSSHDVTTQENGVIAFREGAALDRDVVVRWHATEEHIGCTLVEGGGLPGDDGRYGLVTIVPPTRPERVYDRELTLLLDTSGSMSQRIELAKQLVHDLIKGLQPNDRFELITFSSAPRRLTPDAGYVLATPSVVESVLQSLRQVQAGGCTEMGSAITEAFRRASDDGQRQVVLITDGDVSFESEIVGQVAATRNVRLHCVGVGAVPNRALLRQAAWAGRGVEVLIEHEQDLARASERLRRATGQPVLTQLSIEGAGVAATPEGGLHDVFAQQPLTVAIELSCNGGPVTLKGRLAGTTDAWTHTFTVPAADTVAAETRTPLPLGALFGREQVGALEVQAAVWGPRQEDRKSLEDRIEATALRHRIVSSRTSLVAISEEPAVNPQDPVRRVRLAVEVPADVSAAAVGLSSVACSTIAHSSRHASFVSNATYTSGGNPRGLIQCRAETDAIVLKHSSRGWNPDEGILDPHMQGWTDTSPLVIQPLSVACVGPHQWEVEVEVTEELVQTVVKDGKWLARKVCFDPTERDIPPIIMDPPPPSTGNFSLGRLLILRSTRADRLVPGTIARLVFEFQNEIRPRGSSGMSGVPYHVPPRGSDAQGFGHLVGTLEWGASVSRTRSKGRPSARHVHIPVRLPAKGGA